MDEISVRIGNRLRAIRQQKGISQEELADTADLNRAFVGQVERGQKNATIRTIEKLCIALDVTLHEFFSFELDEIDPQDEILLKASSLLKQLNKEQALMLIDIMKKTIAFKDL